MTELTLIINSLTLNFAQLRLQYFAESVQRSNRKNSGTMKVSTLDSHCEHNQKIKSPMRKTRNNENNIANQANIKTSSHPKSTCAMPRLTVFAVNVFPGFARG